MDGGSRKKRTLAERRESDKMRQRRFRAKKREEARLLQVISGAAVVTTEKKERVYSGPRKTAEEIRETNRIRQQRFRARKRGMGEEDDESEELMEAEEAAEPVRVEAEAVTPGNPVELLQRIILQAANEEKERQTEIRREKDRIRKRRERQRKRDIELRKAGLDPADVMQQKFQEKLEKLEKDMTQWDKVLNRENAKAGVANMTESRESEEPEAESPEMLVKQEVEDEHDVEDDVEGQKPPDGFLDATQFMSQLEQMGLMMGLATPNGDSAPVYEIRNIGESQETTSSSTHSSLHEHSTTPEKKPWQRCTTSEERRERERMRKRMYRAKQKFISTGKLEMQWDPTPIKRNPNDDSEAGITPIPEWTKNLSSEQKLAAHRIYNKRYRERIKNGSGLNARRIRAEEPSEQIDSDLSTLPPEIYTEILATLINQNQQDE
ncbi:unnamed protein product [Caenorhabditis sp. 36 PRJEB53466]|nr:unnamed protein product [Caenorhabditis sp. 36 PRJEB53466]